MWLSIRKNYDMIYEDGIGLAYYAWDRILLVWECFSHALGPWALSEIPIWLCLFPIDMISCAHIRFIEV